MEAGLMCNGESLRDLDIGEYADKEWDWVGINRFGYLQRDFLDKIGKRFKYVYCCNGVRQGQEDFSKVVRVCDGWDIRFNTLCNCILWLERNWYRRVYLFGADGGGRYYKQEELGYTEDDIACYQDGMERDLRVINERIVTGKQIHPTIPIPL